MSSPSYRAWRVRNVARGLRTDGKPRRQLTCCKNGLCQKCNPNNSKRIPLETVMAMYADYQTGMSLRAVGSKHGDRNYRGVAELFLSRGLAIRPNKTQNHCRRKNGSYLPHARKTDAEIAALAEKCKRVEIPAELRTEWREWSWEKRRAFVRAMRESLRRRGMIKNPLPSGPYSDNVEPFEYGQPNIVALAEKLNAGMPSQLMPIKVKLNSQGVIYKEKLFVWSEESSGYMGGPWTPETGRPPLHHVIWEENNGPIPESQTVIFKDGNKNNFAPPNLALRSRADCARENMLGFRIRQSRKLTSTLLSRHNRKDQNANDHQTIAFAKRGGRKYQ